MNIDDPITLEQVIDILGDGVTLENLRARIRRGSLEANRNERGQWYVTRRELTRLMEEVETCQSCTNPAASMVIVKYHHHERVEFALCPGCAAAAQAAYGRQGGVLEFSIFSLHGEGWMQP